MSATRKRYFARLVGRCLIFVLCVLLCLFRPGDFAVLDGMNFFKTLSPLHLLWLVWVADMFLQIIPIRNKVPLGSQKLFANRFRLIMKNRCCTTCRIFNWDHLMMFSPLIYMGGFYAGSLVLMAAVAWLVWELCVMMYPERFWDQSNAALKCSECTDKLCTQYCRKLRS